MNSATEESSCAVGKVVLYVCGTAASDLEKRMGGIYSNGNEMGKIYWSFISDGLFSVARN
jgi:hypothetical protein